MDRKNKKAAQTASGGPAGRDNGRTRGAKGRGGGNVNGQGRNPLLSGSTAPTRVLSSATRPSPFKTSISPSAPAPPVKDTEFSSYGLPDESETLGNASAHGKPPPIEINAGETNILDETTFAPKSPLSPHAINAPSAPRRVAKPTSPKGDFGPIGSPRSASSSHGALPHGLSPGTSPSRGAGISTSPFSAPGQQSTFMQFERSTDDFRSRAGLAASLGATKTLAGMSRGVRGGESAVEEEDLEEFIPGSLSDLLTPEERSRRLSRTNASRPAVGAWDANQRPNDALQHRHSLSVPAPSLLNDVRSIWAEPGAVVVGSPDQRSGVGGGLGNGTPSSFKSTSTFGGRAEDPLSPSNASAAFLPGMHQYLGNRTGQQRNTRPTNSLHPSVKSGAPSSNPSSHGPYLGVNGHGLPPPHLTGFGNNLLDTSPAEPFTAHDFSGRPIPGLRDDDPRVALSPSARALQAHAPGQSLPQGLAAGYSRIHALPPTAMSPSTPGAFSPPNSSGFVGSGVGWDESPGSQGGNLDAAMSRISYSTAASRTPSGQLPSGVRQTSGRGYGPGPFSPLSRPVVTGDDDDLFSMDG